MTYQGEPDRHHATDHIDCDSQMSWARLVLVVLFVAVLGFLAFGPSWIVPADSVKNAQRPEPLNTAPVAPSVPPPGPPKQ